MENWAIGATHPIYGHVCMTEFKGDIECRLFRDKFGTLSLIPLAFLPDNNKRQHMSSDKKWKSIKEKFLMDCI